MRALVSHGLRVAALCTATAIIMNVAFVAIEAAALWGTGDDAIKHNLKRSIETHVLDKWEYPTSPYGHILHKYDMYTECIALGTNLGNAEKSIAFRIAQTPNIRKYPDEMHPCQALIPRLLNGTAHADFPYLRYWQGHQIYLRPLLSMMRLDRIRKLNAVLLYASIALLLVALVPSFGPWAAPVLFVPLALFTDLLTVPAVTVHSLALTWVFCAAAAFAWLIERHHEYANAPVAATFAAGAVYGFFELLFNPPFGAALLAMLSLAHSVRRGRTTLDALARGLSVAALWLGGYAAALLGKWTFAASVLGWRPVFNDILAGAMFRIAGGDEGQVGFVRVLALMWENAGSWGILAGWAVAAALLLRIHRRRGLDAADLRGAALMQAPILILVLWVFVVRNHSVAHFGFASRPFVLLTALPILAALLIGRIARRAPGQQPHLSAERRR